MFNIELLFGMTICCT